MRSQNNMVLCNVVLFVILVILSVTTIEYRLLHDAVLSGKAGNVAEKRYRFSAFPDDLYSFVARQQHFLAGDGKHSCVTLSYYPLAYKEDAATRLQFGVEKNGSVGSSLTSVPLRTAPLEAVRLRSYIVLKEDTLLPRLASGTPWRVQTERLGSSLLSSPRTATAATSANPAPLETTTTTTTTTATTVAPAEGPHFSSSVSSASQHVAANARKSAAHNEKETPVATVAPQQSSLQHANAVVLLMSPTFSSETVPTSIHVDSPSPPGFAEDAELQNQQNQQMITKDRLLYSALTSSVMPAPVTSTSASPALWHCRRCQQFLEKLLPSLEREFLSRYPYPVHILHRGSMPSEVVQYITAVLTSAVRITIEDVAGVLTERVTTTSSLVLEPWLKEMAEDLHYRRRFTTLAPIATPPVVTTLPPTLNDGTAGMGGRAAGGGVMDKSNVTPEGNKAALAVNTGTNEGVAALTMTNGGNKKNNANIGRRINNVGDGNGAATANGGGRGGDGNTNNGNNGNNNEAETIMQILRQRWEQRRFWTGLVFLLPSLQDYDYFWYIDSQSYFLKPLAHDVLVDVVNHTCAVAYHKLSYLTHKRVTDLWGTLMAWNEESAEQYFTADEVQRALSWLSDEQSGYGGKIYSPDCFIMSFAVTRHPAYLDFFHWIDSRPPYSLLKQQWSPLAIYTVFAQLLMEKHGWDSCVLDPFSGFRSTS